MRSVLKYKAYPLDDPIYSILCHQSYEIDRSDIRSKAEGELKLFLATHFYDPFSFFDSKYSKPRKFYGFKCRCIHKNSTQAWVIHFNHLSY